MKLQKAIIKLKSQKGITGADVIISSTIIICVMVVVIIAYINTTYENRNVTRTAGANRIATNILENIEKLTYEEFVKELDALDEESTEVSSEKTYNLNNIGFSTKIPAGYGVQLTVENAYGDYIEKEEQFDLVRQINLKINYKVNGISQSVEFETVKTREMIEETNPPDVSYLIEQKILKDGMNYYPVKYLSTSDAYIKTTIDDDFWYNYSNGEWATIILSKQDESEIFDSNGKFKEDQLNVSDDEYTVICVWIPAFFITANRRFLCFCLWKYEYD